jgi:hypothetical protein
MADLYGVELLGHCLFFKFAPLVAAVQHLQHDPGTEPEPADEHPAFVEIVYTVPKRDIDRFLRGIRPPQMGN